MANVGDVATIPIEFNISTSQPSSTSQSDTHASATATARQSFFDFITLASTEDVKNFLKLASTTPEGGNLVNIWRRAHREGYEKGRKKSLLHNLEK